MGKWTPDYTDDVLHAKISTLVSGAIRRTAVERETTTSITYENFVTDLDTGDSFTTSLVDILVKEIADRRSRNSVSDRSLMSDRTIRSLRTLANSSRGYSSRFRSHARRSVVNLPEYLTAPTHDMDSMMDEDEDEFEIDVAGTTIEGARIPSSDLHEVYVSGGGTVTSAWAMPASSRRATTVASTPSPVSDEWHPVPPPPLRSPTAGIHRPWSTLSNATTTSTTHDSSVSRQASIRRAARSRVDFNESSQRRRWATRESASLPMPPLASTSNRSEVAELVTEPRSGLTWTRPLAAQAATGRRFFPFPRGGRRHESSTNGASSTAGMNLPQWVDLDRMSPDAEDFIPYDQLGEWIDLPNPASPGDAEGTRSRQDTERAINNVIRSSRAPRLRRGGVLAPESLMRHASPVVVTAGSSTGATSSTPSPPPLPAADPENTVSFSSAPSELPPILPSTSTEEPAAYPTPGSTENDNLA